MRQGGEMTGGMDGSPNDSSPEAVLLEICGYTTVVVVVEYGAVSATSPLWSCAAAGGEAKFFVVQRISIF